MNGRIRLLLLLLLVDVAHMHRATCCAHQGCSVCLNIPVAHCIHTCYIHTGAMCSTTKQSSTVHSFNTVMQCLCCISTPHCYSCGLLLILFLPAGSEWFLLLLLLLLLLPVLCCCPSVTDDYDFTLAEERQYWEECCSDARTHNILDSECNTPQW